MCKASSWWRLGGLPGAARRRFGPQPHPLGLTWAGPSPGREGLAAPRGLTPPSSPGQQHGRTPRSALRRAGWDREPLRAAAGVTALRTGTGDPARAAAVVSRLSAWPRSLQVLGYADQLWMVPGPSPDAGS